MKFTEQHIDSLLKVSQNLMKRRDADGVLEDLLDIAMETIKAERGFLVIQNDGDSGQIIRSARNIDQNTLSALNEISLSVIRKVILSKEPILTKNASTDPRFSGQESILIHGIQSVACVPLIKEDSSIGALYMDSRGYQDLFTKQTIDYLIIVASFAVLALDNALKFEQLEEQNRIWREEITRQHGFDGIIGTSASMTRIFDLMARMAPSHLPIMILGESGTGKELVARAIHYNSHRKDKPFMALYCGNLSENLLESELFGHKKGSFTGASDNKKGMLEVAHGGTFLLDEVADIPITLQAKLLRFLQEGEIRSVGDNVVKKVDVRILAATNKDLAAMVKEGKFREDLYYRLNVLTLNIPSLRDRVEDIPLLALHFLRKHEEMSGKKALKMSKKTLKLLQLHNFPGNVRELENIIARSVVMCLGDEIDESCLIFDVSAGDFSHVSLTMNGMSLKSTVRQHIYKVLKSVDGNRSEAKRILEVSRSYLYSVIEELKKDGIEI